jgi:hypothetical protein
LKCACSTVAALIKIPVRWPSSARKSNVSQKTATTNAAILEDGFYGRLSELLVGQTVSAGPKDAKIEKGHEMKVSDLEETKRGLWRQIVIDNEKRMTEIEAMSKTFDEAVDNLKERFENKVEKLQRGDELPPGVMKMVKVFVAVQAQDAARRQNGRTSRQQGRGF